MDPCNRNSNRWKLPVKPPRQAAGAIISAIVCARRNNRSADASRTRDTRDMRRLRCRRLPCRTSRARAVVAEGLAFRAVSVPLRQRRAASISASVAPLLRAQLLRRRRTVYRHCNGAPRRTKPDAARLTVRQRRRRATRQDRAPTRLSNAIPSTIPLACTVIRTVTARALMFPALHAWNSTPIWRPAVAFQASVRLSSDANRSSSDNLEAEGCPLHATVTPRPRYSPTRSAHPTPPGPA